MIRMRQVWDVGTGIAKFEDLDEGVTLEES